MEAEKSKSWGALLKEIVDCIAKLICRLFTPLYVWILKHTCNKSSITETSARDLPKQLMANIIARVLEDPPFLSLYSLSRVCSRWRQKMLSQRYLIYFDNGNLNIIHTRSNTWEVVALDLPNPSSASLELLSSYGGLLFLSSAGNEEMIVCNPLTRRCTKFPHLSEIPLSERKFGTRSLVVSDWCVLRDFRGSTSTAPKFEVVFKETRVHHVEITRKQSLGVRYNHQDRQIKVFNLRGGDDINGADVSNNFSFLVGCTLPGELWSDPTIVLGYATYPDFVEVLRYHIAGNTLQWVTYLDSPTVLGTDYRGTTYRGYTSFKQRFLKGTAQNQLELYEVDRYKLKFLVSLNAVCEKLIDRLAHCPLLRTPISTSSASSAVRKNDLYLKTFHYVHPGDVAFHVGILQVEPNPLRWPFRLVSVLLQNQLDRSDRIADWKEWTPHPTSDSYDVTNFHVFQPSFKSPTDGPVLRKLMFPDCSWHGDCSAWFRFAGLRP